MTPIEATIKKTMKNLKKKLKKSVKFCAKKNPLTFKKWRENCGSIECVHFFEIFEKSSNKSWKITILTWWASFEFPLILRAKSDRDREMMTSRHCTTKNYYLDGKYSDQNLRIFSFIFRLWTRCLFWPRFRLEISHRFLLSVDCFWCDFDPNFAYLIAIFTVGQKIDFLVKNLFSSKMDFHRCFWLNLICFSKLFFIR